MDKNIWLLTSLVIGLIGSAIGTFWLFFKPEKYKAIFSSTLKKAFPFILVMGVILLFLLFGKYIIAIIIFVVVFLIDLFT